MRSEEQLKKWDLFNLEKTYLIWFDLPRFGKSPSRGKSVKRWWMPVFSKACYGERQAFSVQEPQEWFKSMFLMTRNFPHYRSDLNWPGTVRGGLQATSGMDKRNLRSSFKPSIFMIPGIPFPSLPHSSLHGSWIWSWINFSSILRLLYK